MKHLKIASYSRALLFLIGISLLLWNCEKENIEDFTVEETTNLTIKEVQENFSRNFSTKIFKNLPKNPIWEKATRIKHNGIDYLEVPFYKLRSIKQQKSNSISYDKLLAYKDENENIILRVVHYFAIDTENNSTYHSKTSSLIPEYFNGFITIYDLNKEAEKVTRYKNGVESIEKYEIKKQHSNLLLKMPLDNCMTISETICWRTCYWEVLGYDTEVNYDLPPTYCGPRRDCTTTTYTTCGIGGGFFEYQNTITSNEVVPKIINKLTNDCAKNIFTELENGLYKEDPIKPEVTIPNRNNLNFSEEILSLFNDSDKTHYTIQNGTTGGSNASTTKSTTTISNVYLQNATRLSIARTMIHEQIHAYLNGVYFNYPGLVDKPLKDQLRRYASDKGYKDVNRFHHEFMGKYVDAMAYSLYEWDKRYGSGKTNYNNPSPDDLLGWDYYKAMAFGGLFQTDSSGNIVSETDIFKAIEPDNNKRKDIAKKVFNETKGNQNAKSDKCN